MQTLGLEWFYRMLQEPGRLGRRYLIDDSPFLILLPGEIVRRKLKKP
jgi:N-acetylglucosaminyldiphosphoundecaprenol N-acetyl-beta-D-mannosaminyltransferase